MYIYKNLPEEIKYKVDLNNLYLYMDNLLTIFNHMMTSGLHKKYGEKKILNVNYNTVYVGAGTDLETIVQMPDNLNVLMIDSQPYSEFGPLVMEDNKNTYNGFSRIKFIPTLDPSLIGFII